MKVHAENAEGLQGPAERFLAAAAAAKGSLSGRSSGVGQRGNASSFTCKVALNINENSGKLANDNKKVFGTRLLTMRLSGFFCFLLHL
jgi:hypothetical protein